MPPSNSARFLWRGKCKSHSSPASQLHRARDWPVHNWWGGRRRGPLSEGFRFYPWDQEITNLNLAWVDTYSAGARFEEVNSAGTPAAFYDKLRLNLRFRREFGDRVQAVCFAGGPLTPAACQARWLVRQMQIDKSIVAESARSGDARQATSYTREANWPPEMNWIANTWWAGNHPQALQRFRNVSLFSTVVAPMMSQHGGDIAAGFTLSFAAPAGTIYYTTNGVEPISLAGVISSSAVAYTGAIMLNADTVIKARAISAGTTSALTTATFLIANPASAQNVVVSEIHFHPLAGGFEFIELMNVGTKLGPMRREASPRTRNLAGTRGWLFMEEDSGGENFRFTAAPKRPHKTRTIDEGF